MEFIGGWRSRRRRYGPGDDPRYGPGYGPDSDPGYGRRYGYRRPYRRGFGGGFGGGGGSCMRDMFMLEGGCCLAEMLGCGPQLVLLVPATHRRLRTSAHTSVRSRRDAGLRERVLALLLAAIGGYQAEISPHRRACCRYTPTCSNYAAEALETHGLERGLWRSACRLVRCRPGSVGGIDPVPPARAHISAGDVVA